GSICLWDIEHPKTEPVMLPTGAGVLALAFSSDGKTLASAHDDRTVLLWNPQDKQPRALHILKERGSSVVSLALSSDGKILACRTNNGNVELWDLSQGKPKKAPLWKGKGGGRTPGPQLLAFAPAAPILAWCVGSDVQFWDVAEPGPKEPKNSGGVPGG